MRRMSRRSFVVLLLAAIAAPASAQPETQAVERAEQWLALVDAGRYAESWDAAARLFQGAVPRSEWVDAVGRVRQPLGRVVSRTLRSRRSTESLPGAPDGKYVVIQYDTVFERKRAAVETITPMLDADGSWRVSGYYVR